MPANLLRPGVMTFQSSVTKTATFTGATVEIPLADSYLFILDVTAASGTTPTLDAAIQSSVDGGTTFYTVARFAQVTAVSTRKLQLQPMLGRGEAGSESAVSNTGGALAGNVILTKKIRTVWTIGGANPSFTAVMYVITQPRNVGGQGA